MTQRARNLTSAAVIMAASAYWYIEGSGFRPLSAIFPRVLAVIVFVLAALLGILTLIGHGPVIKVSDGDAAARHLRAGTLMVATVIWTALVPILGLLIASVVGVLGIGILTFRAHIGTIRAIIIAVAFVGLFYALFAIVLNVPFPRGVLF